MSRASDKVILHSEHMLQSSDRRIANFQKVLEEKSCKIDVARGDHASVLSTLAHIFSENSPEVLTDVLAELAVNVWRDARPGKERQYNIWCSLLKGMTDGEKTWKPMSWSVGPEALPELPEFTSTASEYRFERTDAFNVSLLP